MSKFKAGFLGCGNMGGTLACVCAEAIGGKSVAVCDVDANKTASMKEKYGCTVVNVTELFENCEFVFLGIKPQYMASAVAGAEKALAKNPGCIVVTMAAGLEISSIRALLGGFAGKIIRIMPNLCARVGEGMILVSASDGVTDEDVVTFEKLLDGAGRFETLPEKLIDAGCALSGSGPAYVYMFIEALADAGVECGLPRDKAQTLAAQTVLGAAKSVLAYGNPGAQKDAVCSPAGTTIAGVHALEDSAFRAASMNAVCAAYERAVELKKLK